MRLIEHTIFHANHPTVPVFTLVEEKLSDSCEGNELHPFSLCRFGECCPQHLARGETLGHLPVTTRSRRCILHVWVGFFIP